MKEFVEKLIGRLENRIKYNELCHKEFPNAKMNFTYEVQINAYKNAIEIVNQLAEEYKEKDCSKCSRRSWYQIGYADAEKKFAEEYGKDTNVTTNADFIRKMNDEELAELFVEKCKVGKEFAMCWLQSEVNGSE